MKDRDYLRELLEETSRRNIKVWLAWTTPGGKYPDTEFSGQILANIFSPATLQWLCR